jgi:hypothetical protein
MDKVQITIRSILVHHRQNPTEIILKDSSQWIYFKNLNPYIGLILAATNFMFLHYN